MVKRACLSSCSNGCAALDADTEVSGNMIGTEVGLIVGVTSAAEISCRVPAVAFISRSSVRKKSCRGESSGCKGNNVRGATEL